MSKSTNMEVDPHLAYLSYDKLLIRLRTIGDDVPTEQLDRILALSTEEIPVSQRAAMLRAILDEISQNKASTKDSNAEGVINPLTAFLEQLRINPSLDISFCSWLSRVDASYLPDLKKLKLDVHSVDPQTARVILLNFADFNKLAST
jgi:hypothetical protein